MTAFRISVAVVSALVAGCAGSLFDSGQPAPRAYVLTPSAAPAASVATLPIDLAVTEPVAAPGLASERIAVVHADRELEYFAGVRWGATAPQVLQAQLVGSMRNQRRFRSVTAAPTGIATTHAVDIELREFQALYATRTAAPTVRITLVANVLRVADRALLAAIPVTVAVPAAENRMTQVVAAFESASREAVETLGAELSAVLAAEAGGTR